VTCKNPDYQDFCKQIYEYVPACGDIDKKNIASSLFLSSNPQETSVVLQIFELGRFFAEKKIARFQSQGMSMYPCIRPKDTLHIEPRSAKQIQAGDIAVFRRFSRLFAHRTIDKGSKNGQDYIVTCSDTTRSGNDGPSFDKDILGIVTRIERKGIILEALPKKHPLLSRLFLDIYIHFCCLGGYLWHRLACLVNHLQQYRIYRILAGFLFINKKIEFSLQAPINARPNSRFFTKISSEELKNSLRVESALSKWMLTVKVNSKPAGYLSILFKPESCPFCGWWLQEVQLKIRYRGTSVETRFLKEAQNLLEKFEIRNISLSAFENTGTASSMKLFLKNMGFKEVFRYKDILLKDKNKAVIERIIMKKGNT